MKMKVAPVCADDYEFEDQPTADFEEFQEINELS
jgi:hypothetical protein